jgi:hypothetical protein
VKNANVQGVSKYHDFFVNDQLEGPIAKKIKLSFGMHPQLTNMDLQEGMVIKDVKYVHLHITKHLNGVG